MFGEHKAWGVSIGKGRDKRHSSPPSPTAACGVLPVFQGLQLEPEVCGFGSEEDSRTSQHEGESALTKML